MTAWKSFINDIDNFREKWLKQMESDDIWIRNKAKQFLKITDGSVNLIEEFNINLMLKILESIEIFEDGRIMVRFYAGSELENDFSSTA